MIKKRQTEMITPLEAAELSSKYGTMDDINRADDIYKAYLKCKGNENISRWHFLRAIAAIYTAGRIQGIREERARRNTKSRAGSSKP